MAGLVPAVAGQSSQRTHDVSLDPVTQLRAQIQAVRNIHPLDHKTALALTLFSTGGQNMDRQLQGEGDCPTQTKGTPNLLPSNIPESQTKQKIRDAKFVICQINPSLRSSLLIRTIIRGS